MKFLHVSQSFQKLSTNETDRQTQTDDTERTHMRC